MWVPLHVTDAPNGLHLWAAGAELVEMPVVALLQQVLAAAVTGELVTHPAGERRGTEAGSKVTLLQSGHGRWKTVRKGDSADTDCENLS